MIFLMNLFENFDPSINSCNFQFNWMFMIIPTTMFPNMFWLIPSRMMMIFKLLIKYMFIEFKIITMNSIMNIYLFLSIMIYIMIMNLFSLMPYIFTMTSHLIFNLMMAFSLWLSFLIYSAINFPMKTLSHLVPLNSPKFLMNFMVIIELISMIIRPWTLSIRLSANLISGHLILTLLSNFMMNFLFLTPFSLIIQNLLLILEISMSMIQAYVFSILLILYFSESIN